MGICTRNSSDPLVKLFKELRINRLLVPRRESPLGQIFICKKGKPQSQLTLDALEAIGSNLTDIDRRMSSVEESQKLENISSSALDLDVGANLLANLLSGVSREKLHTALRAKSVTSLRVSLVGPTCQRLNDGQLMRALSHLYFSDIVSEIASSHDVFIVTVAWSAGGLEVFALDDSNFAVDIGAEVEVAASGGLSGKRTTDRFKKFGYTAREPLYFGVEVKILHQRPDKTLMLRDYNPGRGFAGDNEVFQIEALAEIWSDDEIETTIVTKTLIVQNQTKR